MSLHPQKAKRSRYRKRKASYTHFNPWRFSQRDLQRFDKAGFGWGIPSVPKPGARFKAILFLLVISTGVMFALQAALPADFGSPNANGSGNPDPFNVIWDGQVATSFSSPSSGPITFHSSVNATRSSAGCSTPCTGALPALSVLGTDTIIVTAVSKPVTGTTSPTFTVADTQSNTYTQQVQEAWQGHSSDWALVIFSATASATGSDTITLTGSDGGGNFMQWFSTGSDYSGVGGFGNTATAFTFVHPANSGTNTITITSASTGSSIIELAVSSALGGSINGCNAGGNQMVMTTSNGQKQRNGNCQGGDAQELTDVTGLSGSNTIGFAWTNNIANCDGTNGCSIIQVGLELTGSSSSGSPCTASYTCQNAKFSSGNLFVNPNATFPGIAISNSSVDLSTSASKSLAFTMTGIVNSSITTGQRVAWFLTANQTLPRTAGYDPLNDTNVVLAVYGVKQSAATMNYYVYLQRQPGQILSTGSADPGSGNCQYGQTQFRCVTGVGFNVAGGSNNFHLVLNFTGGSNGSGGTGQSYLCAGSVASGPDTCQVGGIGKIADQNGGALTFPGFLFNQTLFPWINIQNNYHVGLWASSGGQSFEWVTATLANGAIFSVWTPNVALPGTTTEGGFFGWVGRALGGAWNAVAGTLGPIVAPVLGLGNSILAVVISALVQFLNIVISGTKIMLNLTLLEIQIGLNVIGNFFGWGNIGTQFVSFVQGVIQFFTVGLATALGWLLSLILRSLDLITTLQTWFSFYINGLTNLLTNLIALVGFVVTLGTQFTAWYSTSYVLLEILFFIWYSCDAGLAGWYQWFETSKWLAFVSYDILERMLNFGISSITWLFGRIPTLDGTVLPNLPTVSISGGPHFPGTQLEAIRSGDFGSLMGVFTGGVILFWWMTSGLAPGVPGNSAFLALTPLFYVFFALGGLILIVIIPFQLFSRVFGLGSSVTLPAVGFGTGSFTGGSGGFSGGTVSGSFRRREGRFGNKAQLVVHRGLGAGGLRPHIRKTENQKEQRQKLEAQQRANALASQKAREQSDLARRTQERLAREEQQRQRIAVKQAGG